MPARFPSTLTALKRSVAERCATFRSTEAIGSFEELLSLSVSPGVGPRPFGETRQDVPSKRVVDLTYTETVTFPGGGP